MKSALQHAINFLNWTFLRSLSLFFTTTLPTFTSSLNQRYAIFTVSNFPEPYWDVFNSKQLFFFTRTLRK